MNAKITNFFCNSSKNWKRSTNLASAGSGNKVDGLLFLFHPLDVVGETGLFRVRVGGVEPKQFGQPSSVGLVLNHSQFNAEKMTTNHLRTSNTFQARKNPPNKKLKMWKCAFCYNCHSSSKCYTNSLLSKFQNLVFTFCTKMKLLLNFLKQHIMWDNSTS